MEEQIKVNTEAADARIQTVYESSLRIVKSQANSGQRNFRLQFEMPNYGDGHRVTERLEKHGIKVSERGFASYRKNDGSYSFDISMQLAN